MIERISKASRRDQTGFTLIELLVVIIVIGILAAVVVFAVGGVGDRGKQSSVQIDARTIRTAEETFCSQNGRYGTVADLVTAGLVSANSTLNQVFIDTSFGPCNNTSFQVFPSVPAVELGPLDPACGIASWCNTSSANTTSTNNGTVDAVGGEPMLLMPNGKILVAKVQTGSQTSASCPGSPLQLCVMPFQVFDPAGGSMGSWSPLAPHNSFGGTSNPVPTPNGAVPNARIARGGVTAVNNMTVLKGNAAWCGSNCGKILVHVTSRANNGLLNGSVPDSSPWKLYDPNSPEVGTESLGSWINLSVTLPTLTPPGGGPYRRNQYNSFVQLTRTPCGAICGKVLIVGQGGEGNSGGPPATPAIPEIWDPADGPLGSFRKLSTSDYHESDFKRPTLTPLPDGKILMLVGSSAQVFDPVTEKFTDISRGPVPTSFLHSWGEAHTAVLPDGSVLATFNDSSAGASAGAAIYRHSSPNPWSVVQSCGDGTPNGNRWCLILGRLFDGRIVAKRIGAVFPFDTVPARTEVPTQPLQILDTNPQSATYLTWSALPSVTPADAGMWAVSIPETRPGSCGNLCNRVLTSTRLPISATQGATVRIYTP